MKHFINLSYILLISLFPTVFTFAQTPAPTPAADKPRVSLKTLPPTEEFFSTEGRFAIALPKDGSEFEPTAPTAQAPKETGGTYTWSLKEGVIVVGYVDNPDISIKTEKDYVDLAEGMRTGIAGSMGAKIVSERPLKLGEYRGYEVKYELSNKSKGISRMYIVDGRSYTLLSIIFPEPAGGMELAAKAMDSFVLIAPALQEPEKPKEVMTQQAAKRVSLQTLPATEKFTSADKRFTIALPMDIAEFEALKPSEDSPRETGGKYTWVVKEGVITIDYSDDPGLVIKSEEDYAYMAEGMKTGITAFGATVLSEKMIKVGNYRGYEIRFESMEKLRGLSRMLIVGGRKYAVFSLAFPDIPGGAELLNKAMDTFTLTSAPVRKAVKRR